MYLHHYGLRESPFELTPNPKFLFFTPKHREALSNLEYGLSTAKSITVLIGEAGTGKTTLLRAAVESERCRNAKVVYLSNPALKRDEFVQMLARKFDLSPTAAESKTALLAELEHVLLERRRRGIVTALVVDEAQTLSRELLEEVRLLANIETATEKLLPLVLSGQPELAERLEAPTLRQLKQRVALRCEVTPLDLMETAAYIASRIRTAGGEPVHLFTREAVQAIHGYSRGIPRTISVICDNALVSAYALQRRPVDLAIVSEIGRDFALARPTSAADDEVDAPRERQRPAPVGRADALAPPHMHHPIEHVESRRSQASSDPLRPSRFHLFGR